MYLSKQKNEEMKKQFPLALIIILFFVVVSSVIFTPTDKVVKEDSEYMYITQYSVYGLDSTTTKYHKSVQYEGKVVSKKIDEHFIGRLVMVATGTQILI